MSICDATRIERLEISCCICSCHRILTVPAGKPEKNINRVICRRCSSSKSREAGACGSNSRGSQQPIALSPTGKVEKEAAPGFTLAGFLRWFSWWHFTPTKIIAGDGHLRCHLDRKIGNFLLQLLVPSDLSGSSRKTCKNDDVDDDDEKKRLKQK